MLRWIGRDKPEIPLGGNLWTPQKGNVGPHFGFAWSPPHFNNRFVVRGGYGLNFNEEGIAISGNAVITLPASLMLRSPAAAQPASIRPSSTP